MSDAKERRLSLQVASVLALSVGIVFLPSLPGGFVWDDMTLIVHDAFVHDVANVGRAFATSFWDISSSEDAPNVSYGAVYRPVVKVLFLIEYALFGAAPLGYHAVNVGIHVACAVLVYWWIRRRLFGSGSPGRGGSAAAAIGAAFFALHPTRPETVTWISGASDLLMATFALGALLLLGNPRSRLRVVFGCVSLALAVLSKEPAVLIPILLTTDAVLLPGPSEAHEPGADMRRVTIVAAFATAAVAFVVRFFFVERAGMDIGEITELPVRVATSLGHYLSSTFMPLAPSVHPAIRQLDSTGASVFEPLPFVFGSLAVLAVLALALASRKWPALRPWLADALYFFILLAPVANILDLGLYSVTSERFLYLPHIGVAALAARGLGALAARRRGSALVPLLLGAFVVVLMVAVTVPRQGEFMSNETLWTAEYERNPENVSAARELALIARNGGRAEEALTLLVHAYRRAKSAHDRRQSTDLLLEIANLRLTTLPDVAQEELRALRSFFEALVRREPARLEVPGLSVTLMLDDFEREVLVENVTLLRVPLATALLRTLEVERAIAVLEAIVAEDERSVGGWHLLVTARARAFDFDGAQLAAAEAARRLPGHPGLARARNAVAAAQRELSPPPERPLDLAVAQANAQVHLGAPEAARRLLAPYLEREPTHAALVLARARADIADRQYELARDVIRRARALDPAHQAEWDHALLGVDDAAQALQTASAAPPASQ